MQTVLHRRDPLSRDLHNEAGVGLRHAWLELTNQCNLACKHCYNDSGPTKVSLKPLEEQDYQYILSDLKSAGCRSIQFIGGEPTLCKFLPQLIEHAVQLRFERVEVFSNLTHISDSLLNLLKARGVQIACSFYSNNAAVHDNVTARVGSHARTKKTITRVVWAGIPIRAGIIVIPGVNDDHVDDTKEYLRGLGVMNIGVDYVRAIGRAQTEGATKSSIADQLCGRCSDGSICIDPEGNVSPCIMSRAWRLGSIREAPISSMFSTAVWSEFSAIMAERAAYSRASCNPEDDCSPGACHPQIGGPDDCFPQNNCAPDVLPCHPESIGSVN